MSGDHNMRGQCPSCGAEPAHTDHPMRHHDRTCPACREDAEPVAYLWQHCETGRTRIVMPDDVITADATWFVVGPLFTHPAKQVPMTEDEIEALADKYLKYQEEPSRVSGVFDFARAIEARLGNV